MIDDGASTQPVNTRCACMLGNPQRAHQAFQPCCQRSAVDSIARSAYDILSYLRQLTVQRSGGCMRF
jgi:hypothetical protein